ncbi:hypothetical protein G6F46_000726 [Rhizopus delemar]|uniref:Histone deacetylase interacting domain-containing protein n=2 Tax=Rhizopus TaxID=4842 RepID=A0A9P7CUP6_9FUNG|nr:hypothetical protein G6F55_000893 [Rhizopus delemar]KAG1552856.1 hypothetical protein G6F51_000949 [Rhizopus arrhizus]KAG1501380.1 hypothetical protein G6F54_003074 [Rhizopus delemar]KAG1517717.1 hypothetical protein G6F53_001161 [Rhizopus delemar]KAG1563125.1 hypothetical protein G6F49_000281 [Rhizopus delemar]
MLEESLSTTTQRDEFRPLNVKDALTYLDQVKTKFANQPDIYNHFLDIMKDFKSQLIDTPGVIERVSSLFKGHPNLISGFNTFLPPGYSIECSIDERERNMIKVTTPSGTTTISDSEPLNLRQDTVEQKETTGPLEINHAITYVHKIKNYFFNQPDVYKRFLEILQTYQKGGKPIQKVYEEVKVLFNGSTELLNEFKQFLPEPKQKKKRSGNIPSLSISKKSKHHHYKEDAETSDVRSGPNEEMEYARPTFSAEEAEFFDKAKTYIGNKVTYNAFLKVLNLFSQQMVDQNVLVSRVESFIGGDKELFDQFKILVGYNGNDEIIENVPVSNPKPVLKEDSERDTAINCGPSYRHISKAWQNNVCSGRDALCWDVLNDTYISHPTWASEDTNSVASKKNQYEEALHRVEEERYDYDLNIEANLTTIALLEPIMKKISLMTADEKTSFKLSSDFGSSSKTVYQRILKKVYGAQKGLEIINLLHSNPAQTVPVVLKRLRQKDDEWKRAQREWNKIWREVESKNYWKSLDYQGITFKTTDRKTLATRSLVAEAEAVKLFNYEFQDASVFKDVSRLVYFFLGRQPVYNPDDCESMRRSMNMIIPMMFDLQDVEPSIMTVEDIIMEEADDDEFDDKSSVHSLDSLSASQQSKKPLGKRSSRRNRYDRDDGLLKNVLMRNTGRIQSSSDEEDADDEEEQEQIKRETSVEEQEQQQEDTEDEQNEKMEEDQKEETEKEVSSEPENQRMYHFFADNGFYCFFRLYQALYDRLYKMKKLDSEFRKNREKSKKACKEALDLGITPRRFKALKMDTKKGYYNVLLALIDKLFEGDIDQQTFEESVRYIFGADAYILFTIDKLVLSLVRHIHIIITDTHSQELFDIFSTEHRAEQLNQGDVMTYRTKIMSMLDPTENIYHITFKLQSRKLTIQLLDDNKQLKKSHLNEADYDEYVANYIDWAKETKGIDQSLLTQRFLKRNLKDYEQQPKGITVHSGLQYKICRDTYHMFYIIGTEDVFVRRCSSKHQNSVKMNNTWKEWLDKKWDGTVDKLEAEQETRRLLQQ